MWDEETTGRNNKKDRLVTIVIGRAIIIIGGELPGKQRKRVRAAYPDREGEGLGKDPVETKRKGLVGPQRRVQEPHIAPGAGKSQLKGLPEGGVDPGSIRSLIEKDVFGLPVIAPIQGVPRGSPQDPPVPDAGYPATAEQTAHRELLLFLSHSRICPGEGCNELRVFETGLDKAGKPGV